MKRRSKRIKAKSRSGGKFAHLPRKCVVDVLLNFDIYVVARSLRSVCVEFRDAGQERIHGRGGRLLFEESMVYRRGLNFQPINVKLSTMLMDAALSIVGGCKIANIFRRLQTDLNLEKNLIELRKMANTYHYAAYFMGLHGKHAITSDAAATWFQKSIDLSIESKEGINTEACLELALCESMTLSTTKPDALQLIQDAAKSGNSRASFRLGKCYTAEYVGLKTDYGRSLALYTQSAEQGYEVAQYYLGMLYYDGDEDDAGNNEAGTVDSSTIPRNCSLAYDWMLKAATGTDVRAKETRGRAQYNIGIANRRGIVVNASKKKTYTWFLKSANSGNKNGQFGLAGCLEHGIGIRTNGTKAMRWYERAAAQGYQPAVDAIERLAGIEIEVDN